MQGVGVSSGKARLEDGIRNTPLGLLSDVAISLTRSFSSLVGCMKFCGQCMNRLTFGLKKANRNRVGTRWGHGLGWSVPWWGWVHGVGYQID